MPEPKGYSATQIALHWGILLLIAAQVVFNAPMTEAWEKVQDGGVKTFDLGVMAHIIGGLTVLGLVMWRLALRRGRGVPAAPAGEAPLLRLVAHGTHVALYGLMLLVPVSGVIAWFGNVAAAAEAHEVMKTLLIVLILLHAAAALYHQFWLKDGLLNRMRQPQD